MLLCEAQKNPIEYKGRNIVISDKAANAHYHMCNMPVNATTVGMYIGFYLKEHENDFDLKLNSLSDKELTEIVENGVKQEFVDLLGETEWERIKG